MVNTGKSQNLFSLSLSTDLLGDYIYIETHVHPCSQHSGRAKTKNRWASRHRQSGQVGVIEGSAVPKADSSVLVQAAIKECHRLASLNSKHIFLRVLEACRPMISVLAWSSSGEGPLLIYRWPLSCCVLMWLRERASSLPLSMRALIPSCSPTHIP